MTKYFEYWKSNDDGDKTLIVVNDYGNGMLFTFDETNECYKMLTIGSPVAYEVRNLIKKYDHYE